MYIGFIGHGKLISMFNLPKDFQNIEHRTFIFSYQSIFIKCGLGSLNKYYDTDGQTPLNILQ